MYYVYVLYSKKLDKLYIGYTENLQTRLHDHKRGKTWTTTRMGDAELAYYEACVSKKDASARERQLKTGFGRAYLRKRITTYLGA